MGVISIGLGWALILALGTVQAKTQEGPDLSATGNEPASKPMTSPVLNTSTNVAIVSEWGDSRSRTASIALEDLTESADLSPAVKRLLEEGLALAQRNLSYQYGSADPENGGMDCSGTIYYLLRRAGVMEVPRDSSGQYSWIWKESRFQAVISSNPDTFELKRLKPGDLLFWTGTYRIDRDPPVTHVMIYLGTDRHNGHRLMLGASDGRTFEGKPRYGVSVFDFKLPGAMGKVRTADTTPNEEGSRFVGYGSIPGLEGEDGSMGKSKSAPTSKGPL